LTFRIAAALSFALLLPTSGQARQVFDGSEAAALRCSNTLALTAVALSSADLIGNAEKDVMLSVSVLILDKHVSGTWGQKKSALKVMRDRRTVSGTIDDYRRNAAKCLQQFPIN
jgi:hypothetical protein